jgi:hypothetical protein
MSEQKILTPKFLTPEMAEKAIDFAVMSVLDSPFLKGIIEPKRRQLHVGVLVPGMVDFEAENYPASDWPNYPTRVVLLKEKSFGDPKEFPWPFDNIARCKGLQLWTDRNDDRTDCQPHLLFPGDTPYWGGVKRRGIVVFCSGVQPWIDKMISGIVADTLVAAAYGAWMDSKDRAEEESFLT